MIDRYRQADIVTASPVMLVVKLYEGAIRHATRAREHLEAGNIAERAESISKALAIVGELHSSLDFEQGGDVAGNLDNLYAYLTTRLMDANLSSDVGGIDDAVSVLETLLAGWKEIAQSGQVVEAPIP